MELEPAGMQQYPWYHSTQRAEQSAPSSVAGANFLQADDVGNLTSGFRLGKSTSYGITT